MMSNILLSFLLLFPLMTEAQNPVVRNTTNGVELRNNRVSIILSNNAELLSITELSKGRELSNKSKKKIAYIKTTDGKTIEASKLTLEGENLDITIGRHRIKLKVQAFKDYFTAEVQNTSLPGVDVLSFIDLKLDAKELKNTSYSSSGIAMSLQTNHVNYPSIDNNVILGQCTSQTGLLGAKLAIVISPQGDFWNTIRDVYQAVTSKDVPVLKSGGPFAKENPANRSDCVIVSGDDVSASSVPIWCEFYPSIGVRQVAVHIGNKTCTQGQFEFPKFGSAASFKSQVSDPLYSAGIITILHTYAYYISPLSSEILSNPKWQQQLEFRDEYALTSSVGTDSKEIRVSGDLSYLKDATKTGSVHTPYLLIDNEILLFENGGGGVVTCKRGQCGTQQNSHKKGSKVRVIGGYFNYMAPQVGSDLFYEIARRTAKAYNAGGFRGLYFDALDGLRVHLKYAGLSDYLWYYGAAFVNEVLKNCNIEPRVVEYSTMFPTLWSARGRAESWDTPNRGYKNFIDDHIKRNQFFMSRNYVGILGWYNFFPIRTAEPEGFSTKYMFSDDVDYLGVKVIAYDQAMVYNGLYKRNVDKIPGLQRNLERYAQYSRLKNEDYFSDRVKSILKEGEYEYRLDQKRGRWGFYEMTYCRSKLRDIKNDRLSGDNPFKRQKPFIRLENLYSSDCSSTVNLLQTGQNVVIKERKTEKEFITPLDLSKHLGLKVTLMGHGVDSKDGLCIRLRSTDLSGYADYVVRLNFEGWRDVIITSLDNAETPDLNFVGMDDERYNMHRNYVDYSKIKYLQITKSAGCADVYLRSIEAVPLVSNTISNPTVRIGGSTVTFNDNLKSGEYLEYFARDKEAMIYDRLGKSRVISVKRTGRLRVPVGEFTATVAGDNELINTPSEVILTVGVKGEFITN